ncbi:MAG: hypothetical protein K2K84_01925, partial [Muribaculaceae bacterium]|nr:hypothetical protein [Muribaculaceae bacterium]
MKYLSIPFLPELEDSNNKDFISETLRFQAAHDKIDCINWPEVTSYAPDARFFIAHSGKRIYILFENVGMGLK